ncbi:MAG: LysR family transcriptional regulator [Sphingorhabdus sp.]
MHWDDLRFFLAAARSKTMATAARRLNVDATTVSRRIERLSTSLNTNLFDSGPDGMTLTDSGKRLFQDAEEVERSILNASDLLTGARGRLEGSVRISLSEGFAAWVVARHLGEFRELHPDISLEIVTTNGFLNPSKREADLAVMLGRPTKGLLVTRKLTDYALGLYASRGYLAKYGQPGNVDELRQRVLIGYIPDFIYAEELRYLSEIHDDLTPTLSSSSINIQLEMTRAGLGVSVLPKFMTTLDDELRPVLPDIQIDRSFWVVVHRDLTRVARVRAVIDWLDGLGRNVYSAGK